MNHESANKALKHLIGGNALVYKKNNHGGLHCRTYNALITAIFDHFKCNSAGFNYSNNPNGTRQALLTVADKTGNIIFSSNKITLV